MFLVPWLAGVPLPPFFFMRAVRRLNFLYFPAFHGKPAACELAFEDLGFTGSGPGFFL